MVLFLTGSQTSVLVTVQY